MLVTFADCRSHIEGGGETGQLTHFLVKIFEVLLPQNHSHHFEAKSMKFSIKLLMEYKHENIQVQLVVSEIFGKIFIKVNGVG